MNDPSFDVISIHDAAKELRQAFAPMSMTDERRNQIILIITKLQQATDNLNRWLDEKTLLQ